MTEQERTRAAEKAAEDYSPVMMNQDPSLVRFARRCYAEGYADALADQEEMAIREHGLIGHLPVPPRDFDWQVGPY